MADYLVAPAPLATHQFLEDLPGQNKTNVALGPSSLAIGTTEPHPDAQLHIKGSGTQEVRFESETHDSRLYLSGHPGHHSYVHLKDPDGGVEISREHSTGQFYISHELLKGKGGAAFRIHLDNTVEVSETLKAKTLDMSGSSKVILPKNPNAESTPSTPSVQGAEPGQMYWDESSIWIFTGSQWEKSQLGRPD